MSERKSRLYPAAEPRPFKSRRRRSCEEDIDTPYRNGTDVVLDLGDSEAVCRVAGILKDKCACGGTQYHLEQVREDSSWLYVGTSCAEHLTRVQ